MTLPELLFLSAIGVILSGALACLMPWGGDE